MTPEVRASGQVAHTLLGPTASPATLARALNDAHIPPRVSKAFGATRR